MCTEDWLYPLTVNEIAKNHALNLNLLMGYCQKIQLPSCDSSGTASIQIDIVAADIERRVVVLAECKNFITFQGVSECAEQLVLKTYLLEKHLLQHLGDPNRQTINLSTVADYSLLRYVALGRQGTDYKNASVKTDEEAKLRMDMYLDYMARIGRCNIGILIFPGTDSLAVVKRATARKWKAFEP